MDGPDGLALQEGRIVEKTVLKARSYVCEPMRYGNLFLAGDAGHHVPAAVHAGCVVVPAGIAVAEDLQATSRSP